MTPLEDLRYIAADLGPEVEKIANVVLADPRFPLWAGGVEGKHHSYTGGLLNHTWEVVKLSRRVSSMFEGLGHKIDEDELFLAALFHDLGKILDYEPFRLNEMYIHSLGYTEVVPMEQLTSSTRWRAAPHKRFIHHITRSAIEWSKAVELTGCCKYIEQDVLHAILSHHGRREWGSPVEPKTKVAWILHCCDQLSARCDDCDRLDLSTTS